MQSQFSFVRSAALAIAAGALSIAACGGSTTTDTGPATGSDAGTGSGDAMGEGSTGSDSGTDAASGTDSAPDGGTNRPFGDPCTADGNCASNVCFAGGMGSYCSLHCTIATQATDCPSPPTTGKCNGMGYCKK